MTKSSEPSVIEPEATLRNPTYITDPVPTAVTRAIATQNDPSTSATRTRALIPSLARFAKRRSSRSSWPKALTTLTEVRTSWTTESALLSSSFTSRWRARRRRLYAHVSTASAGA